MSATGIKGWPERLWRIWDDVTERTGGFVNVADRSLFQELMTAEYTGDITLDPTHGLTDYHDVTQTPNGGAIDQVDGAYRLRTGSTSGGEARLFTVQRLQYIAAVSMLAGVAVFRPTAPTGNQELRWGYYDDNDGFRFGEDATSLYVQLLRGGAAQTKVRRSEWLDPLDGTGASGLTLDLRRPTVFRIKMNLYGQGPAEMNVVVLDGDGRPHLVTVHRFVAPQDGLLVHRWSLPLRQEALNGGDASSVDLFVGGRQGGIIGNRFRQPRTTSETVFEKSLSGETIVPLITFRKKASIDQINVRVSGFTPLSANDIQVLVLLNATVTVGGAGLTDDDFRAPTNIDASETALEVNTTGDAISGGNALYEEVVTSGSGNRTDSPGPIRLGQELPEAVPVTLAMRRVSGTGGTASATFRMEEDF